jgi:hypothetical protein
MSLRTIKAEHDPKKDKEIFIVARVLNADQSVAFYLAEGGHLQNGYEVWGFVVAIKLGFRFPIPTRILLAELELGNWLGGSSPVIDSTFRPKDWLAIRNEIFPPAPRRH